MRYFYLDHALSAGHTVALPKPLQRRLTGVLRLKPGQELAVFNGRDGVFQATLADAATLAVQTQLSPFTPLPSCRLWVGLPKKETFDRVLRQATEMGVTEIQPLLTEFTVPTKLNLERVQAILIEAAEQCERQDLPALHAPIPLPQALKNLTEPLAWAYERLAATPAPVKPCRGVLIGPEGGFSSTEIELLQQHPQIQPISLGKTILRVDTAVVAGLSSL